MVHINTVMKITDIINEQWAGQTDDWDRLEEFVTFHKSAAEKVIAHYKSDAKVKSIDVANDLGSDRDFISFYRELRKKDSPMTTQYDTVDGFAQAAVDKVLGY